MFSKLSRTLLLFTVVAKLQTKKRVETNKELVGLFMKLKVLFLTKEKIGINSTVLLALNTFGLKRKKENMFAIVMNDILSLL